MLRITTHPGDKALTFQLEGRLAGPWVHELDRCSRAARHRLDRNLIRFDLTNVTYVDTAGREYLKKMHRSGAEFVAADCLMRAIVEEIARPQKESSDLLFTPLHK